MGIINRETAETGKTEADFKDSDSSTGFGNIKNIIVNTLHSAAESLAESTVDPDDQSGLAQYGKQASEWLDQSAEYVRRFDYDHAGAGIREYFRQRPGRSLLIAGGIGLAIGAILRRR